MVAALVIVLFLFLFAGVPIYMCLTGAGIVALIGFTNTSPTIIAQTVFAGLDKMGLMAMPLFMFAAQIMLEGGIARRLLDWMKALIGRIPGGTAFTTHFTCMVFGALCGSSPATVASIGGIMYPELCQDKYDKSFSLGLISSSSAVAILIPPSVTMVIYGVATGASVVLHIFRHRDGRTIYPFNLLLISILPVLCLLCNPVFYGDVPWPHELTWKREPILALAGQRGQGQI